MFNEWDIEKQVKFGDISKELRAKDTVAIREVLVKAEYETRDIKKSFFIAPEHRDRMLQVALCYRFGFCGYKVNNDKVQEIVMRLGRWEPNTPGDALKKDVENLHRKVVNEKDEDTIDMQFAGKEGGRYRSGSEANMHSFHHKKEKEKTGGSLAASAGRKVLNVLSLGKLGGKKTQKEMLESNLGETDTDTVTLPAARKRSSILEEDVFTAPAAGAAAAASPTYETIGEEDSQYETAVKRNPDYVESAASAAGYEKPVRFNEEYGTQKFGSSIDPVYEDPSEVERRRQEEAQRRQKKLAGLFGEKVNLQDPPAKPARKNPVKPLGGEQVDPNTHGQGHDSNA